MKTIISLIALVPMLVQAQLANPGFENWQTTENFNEAYPQGWPLLENIYLFKSTDAYEGDYALTVSAWYAYLKTVAIQENAIAERPVSFNGHYRYTDNIVRYHDQDNNIVNAPDTAIISVWLTKWNNAAQVQDTIGKGQIELEGSLGYTHFSCPITYFSEAVPDSVKVMFDPSKVRRFIPDIYRAYNLSECSFLTIDALYFENQALTNPEPDHVRNAILYPNPANESIMISRDDDKVKFIEMYDNTGRLIHAAIPIRSGEAIATEQLAAGIYHALLLDNKKQPIKKLKFVKQ